MPMRTQTNAATAAETRATVELLVELPEDPQSDAELGPSKMQARIGIQYKLTMYENVAG